MRRRAFIDVANPRMLSPCAMKLSAWHVALHRQRSTHL